MENKRDPRRGANATASTVGIVAQQSNGNEVHTGAV
jgi:hypothetical protein